jgi:hypothetical protein
MNVPIRFRSMMTPRLLLPLSCAVVLLASAAPALGVPKPDPAPGSKTTTPPPKRTPTPARTPTPTPVHHYVAPVRHAYVAPTTHSTSVTPVKPAKKPVKHVAKHHKKVVHKPKAKPQPVVPQTPIKALLPEAPVAAKSSSSTAFWLLAALLVVIALAALGAWQIPRWRGRKAELSRREQLEIRQVAGGYMKSYFGATNGNAAPANGDQQPLVSSGEHS